MSEYQRIFNNWRSGIVEDLSQQYDAEDVIGFAQYLSGRTSNVRDLLEIDPGSINDPMRSAVLSEFQSKANTLVENRMEAYASNEYFENVNRMMELAPEQRSYVHANLNLGSLTVDKMDRMSRLVDRAGQIRVIGDDEARPLTEGSRGLSWASPTKQNLHFTYDDVGQVEGNEKDGFGKRVQRRAKMRGFSEVIDEAVRGQGIGGLQPIGETVDIFNRPVQRFQRKLTKKQRENGELPDVIDFSYEATTNSVMVGLADSSKNYVIRPSMGIEAVSNPTLGDKDNYPALQPGKRMGVGNIIGAIVQGKGNLSRPVKRRSGNKNGWTEEFGGLESVDINQATPAQIADLGSRVGMPTPDVGSLEPELLDKMVRELNTSVGKTRFSVADYGNGYLQDNDKRLKFAKGFMLNELGEPTDITTGSTKDLRRNFRGGSKGAGPATGVMFNDPQADRDGLFTSRLKAKSKNFTRGQRMNINISDARALFGEGEYRALEGQYVQDTRTIPLWSYAGKSIDDLPIKKGQLFSRPGHQLTSVAKGVEYAGTYGKAGTLNDLQGFHAGNALETVVQDIQIRKHELDDGNGNTITKYVPTATFQQSAPMGSSEFKTVSGQKGSGSPTKANDPVMAAMGQHYGEMPHIIAPIASKRDRLDSQALLAFESVAELGVIADYMERGAASVRDNTGELKYSGDQIKDALQLVNEQGDILGSAVGAPQEMLENAFGLEYDDSSTDIALQAARMYMRDNMQKVRVNNATVAGEDFEHLVSSIQKRASDRFDRHWANEFGTDDWQTGLSGEELQKFAAWRDKAMRQEVKKTIPRHNKIEQPGGHSFYNVDYNTYSYQGMMIGDMLSANFGHKSKLSLDAHNAISQTQPNVARELERQVSDGVIRMTNAATMMKTYRANIFDGDDLSDEAKAIRANMELLNLDEIDFGAEEARTATELGTGAKQSVIEKMTLERLASEHGKKSVEMGNVVTMPLKVLASGYEIDETGDAMKSVSTEAYRAMKVFAENQSKIKAGANNQNELMKQASDAAIDYLTALDEHTQNPGVRKEATRYSFDAPSGQSSMIMGLPDNMRVMDDETAKKYIERLAKDKTGNGSGEYSQNFKEIWHKFQTEGLWGISGMSGANREQMWQKSHFVSASWLRGDGYDKLKKSLANDPDRDSRIKTLKKMNYIEKAREKVGYNSEFFEQFKHIAVDEGALRTSPAFIRGQNKDADGDNVGQHIITTLGANEIYDPTHGDTRKMAAQAIGDEFSSVSKYGISMPDWLDQNIESGKPTKTLTMDKAEKSYREGMLATKDMKSTFEPFVRSMFGSMLMGSRMAGVTQEQEERIRAASDSGTALYQWAMDKNLLKSKASETLMYGMKEMTVQSQKNPNKKGGSDLYPAFFGHHYKQVQHRGEGGKTAVDAASFMFDMIATHAMHRAGTDEDRDAWYGTERSNNHGLSDVQGTMLTRFHDVGNEEVEGRVRESLNRLFESGADAGLSQDEESGQWQFNQLTFDQRKDLMGAITGQEYKTGQDLENAIWDYMGFSEDTNISRMSAASVWASSNLWNTTAERAEKKNAENPYLSEFMENVDRKYTKRSMSQASKLIKPHTQEYESLYYDVKKGGGRGNKFPLETRAGIYRGEMKKYHEGKRDTEPIHFADEPEKVVWPLVREGAGHFTNSSTVNTLRAIGKANQTASKVNYGAFDTEAMLDEAGKLSHPALQKTFEGIQPIVSAAMGSQNPVKGANNQARTQAQIMKENEKYLRENNQLSERVPTEDDVTFVGEHGPEAIVRQPDGGFEVVDADTTRELFGSRSTSELRSRFPNSKFKNKGGDLEEDDENTRNFIRGFGDTELWPGYKSTGMSPQAFYYQQYTGLDVNQVPKANPDDLMPNIDDMRNYIQGQRDENPRRYKSKFAAGEKAYHANIGRMPKNAMYGKIQRQMRAEEAANQETGDPITNGQMSFQVGDHVVKSDMTRNDMEEYLDTMGISPGGNQPGATIQLKPLGASAIDSLQNDFASFLDIDIERQRAEQTEGINLLDNEKFAKRYKAAHGKVASVAGNVMFMERLGLRYDQMVTNEKHATVLKNLFQGANTRHFLDTNQLNPDVASNIADVHGRVDGDRLPGLSRFFNQSNRKRVGNAVSTINNAENMRAVAGAYNKPGEGLLAAQRELVEQYATPYDDGTMPYDTLMKQLERQTITAAQGGPMEMATPEMAAAQQLLTSAKGLGKEEVLPAGINLPELEMLVETAKGFGISAKKQDLDPEKMGKGKAAMRQLRDRFSPEMLKQMVGDIEGGIGNAGMFNELKEAQGFMNAAKSAGFNIDESFSPEVQQAVSYGVEMGKAADYPTESQVSKVEGALPGLVGSMKGLEQFNGLLQNMEDTLPELTSEQKRNVSVMQSAVKVHQQYSDVMKTLEGDTSVAADGIRQMLEPYQDLMKQVGGKSANFQEQIAQYKTQQGMAKGTAQEEEMQQSELRHILGKRGYMGDKARADDRYEELAREGLDTAFGRLGGKKGERGRHLLELYGAGMRGVSALQGTMFSAMMAGNQIIKPMVGMADKYQQQQIGRDMSLLSSGLGSYDDMLDSEYGGIKRRGAMMEQAQGTMGREIYRTYAGMAGAFGGNMEGLARGAGSLASTLGPAAFAGMMGKSMFGSAGLGLTAGVATFAGAQALRGVNAYNDENAMSDVAYRVLRGDEKGALAGIGAASYGVVTDLGGSLGTLAAGLGNTDEFQEGRDLARFRIRTEDYLRSDRGNIRQFMIDNGTDANRQGVISQAFQAEAASQFGMSADEANMALQYQMIYGAALPNTGGPMYAAGQQQRWGTYGFDIRSMSAQAAQVQGRSSANAGAVGAAFTDIDKYLLEIDQRDNQYGTTTGEESIRIQNSMARTGQMNSMLAQAGLNTLSWDYYTSRGGGAARRDNMFAQDAEMRAMSVRSNMALYNDQFESRTGAGMQRLMTGYIDAGDLQSANRIGQQWQGIGSQFQQYSAIYGADNTGDAANQLASLATLDSDEYGSAQAILSGNVYAATAAYQRSRNNLQTTGLGQGMYNLVDMQTGLNPYQMGITQNEAQTLREFDYAGYFDNVSNNDLMNLSPVKMRREMELQQYQLQDRQYEVGRQMDFASFAMQTGGQMAISTVNDPNDAMQQFIDQLEPAAKGLELVRETFEKFGFDFDTGDGRGLRQLEDDQIRINRTQQLQSWQRGEQDIGLAAEGMEMRWNQFFENLGLSREKFSYQTAKQRGDMALDRGMQLQQRGWQREDMAYSRNMADLNFGWKMEDTDLNLRYARGRDRFMLLRQKERDTISYSMESGKRDRDEQRFEVSAEFDDTKFERAVDNFERMTEFQERQFQMQEKHFREQFAMDEKQHQLKVERFNQDRQWQVELWAAEDQRRLLERQFADAQFAITQEMNETAHETQVNLREMGDILKGIGESFSNQQAKFSATRQTLEGLTDVYETLGSSVVDFSQNMNVSLANVVKSVKANVGESVSSILEGTQRMISGIAQQVASQSGGMQQIISHSANQFQQGYQEQQSSGGLGSIIGYAANQFQQAYQASQGTMTITPYATGGYTGDGAINEAAGIVHKGEYVVPQNGQLVVRGGESEMVTILRQVKDILESIDRKGINNLNSTIYTSKPSMRGSELVDFYSEVHN